VKWRRSERWRREKRRENRRAPFWNRLKRP
jgi:hypothetical protein